MTTFQPRPAVAVALVCAILPSHSPAQSSPAECEFSCSSRGASYIGTYQHVGWSTSEGCNRAICACWSDKASSIKACKHAIGPKHRHYKPNAQCAVKPGNKWGNGATCKTCLSGEYMLHGENHFSFYLSSS